LAASEVSAKAMMATSAVTARANKSISNTSAHSSVKTATFM